MIRPQMGKHNRSEMIAVHGTPCAIPPRNSNSIFPTEYIYRFIILSGKNIFLIGTRSVFFEVRTECLHIISMSCDLEGLSDNPQVAVMCF
jgi:hypothetical protein